MQSSSPPENGKPAEGAQSQPPTKSSKQRFKPQLSCTFCRNRKLKCDRQLPCENCVKRNAASTCTYVHGQRERSSQVSKSNSAPKDVQSQVRHLEELVISLMDKTAKNAALAAKTQPPITPDELSVSTSSNATSPSQSSDPVIANTADTEEFFGRISIEDNQLSYVGQSHWAAILDNISLLKDHLGATEAPQKEKDKPQSITGPDLLVGAVRSATRAEIMAALPPRSVTDALVAEFFSVPDMGCSLFHIPTFMKEYNRFWTNPSAMPIMWIGMLFCILSLSVQFWTLSNKSLESILTEQALRDPQDSITNYREKTIQCLILGDYTEPGPYTVETLLLYYISDHFRSSDAQFGSWMMFGLIIRAAMRLGYHRDASHWGSKISVFRGEMQRRLWHMLVHLDLINSLQIGLPRMITDNSFDTQEPRNLLDEDFDEHTTQLPPSRSNDELSSILYSNSKHLVTSIFGMIVDQSNSTNTIPYEEVMRLDKILHERQDQLPEPLKAPTVEDLNSGSPQDRVRKISIDLTFQKARCVLHRKWFFPKKSTAIYPYPYSMKACLDASMRILQTQIMIKDETTPGKALHDHKWKTSSLITHDFLLAAMILCLYLGYSLDAEDAELANIQSESGIRIQWARDDILQALDRSYLIWEEVSSTSKDANKVAKALKSMLSRVRSVPTAPGSNGIRQEAFKLAYAAGAPSSTIYTPPVQQSLQNVTNPGNIGTQWMTPPFTTPSSDQSGSSIPQFDPVVTSSSIMGAMELDWDLWDKQFLNVNLADGNTPPDLWNFDTNFILPDPNANFMQWDLS
ncbi:hypothetical protein L207DRAFT_528925 [Hyaloscypha variabilis F]|uniref:Zn(2)-C6 fungal-type domain-containing protein n=1 Tax=Hyaloscypha variabilis (strain UAMH 11265 / GT02V1 / F) TaxID=1149755 RepID=A0A2J6RQ07_HYAVF|nr:hypothetical protein L207DRAFT_528925 [Hyaloscypha variabilis F]